MRQLMQHLQLSKPMGGPAGFSGETGKNPWDPLGKGWMRHGRHGKRHGDDLFFVKMDEDVRNIN